LSDSAAFAIIAGAPSPARRRAMSSIDVISDDLSLLIWVVIGAGLAVLWLLLVLLPFAVFGTKRRLDRLSDQLAEIHEELRRLNDRTMMGRDAPLRAIPPTVEPVGDQRFKLQVDQDDRLV
jgi:hypothetical protein